MRVKVVCFDRLLQVLILNGLVQGFSREARRCGTGLQVSVNTRKSSTKAQCVSITFWVSFERGGKALSGCELRKLGWRVGKRGSETGSPGKRPNGRSGRIGKSQRRRADPPFARNKIAKGRPPKIVSRL